MQSEVVCPRPFGFFFPIVKPNKSHMKLYKIYRPSVSEITVSSQNEFANFGACSIFQLKYCLRKLSKNYLF